MGSYRSEDPQAHENVAICIFDLGDFFLHSHRCFASSLRVGKAELFSAKQLENNQDTIKPETNIGLKSGDGDACPGSTCQSSVASCLSWGSRPGWWDLSWVPLVFHARA